MNDELLSSIDALMTNQKNIILDCIKSISREPNVVEIATQPQIDELQMLTADEVATLLKVHRNQISMYRDMGILKGTKTGKNFMYSKSEIMEFQKKFRGYDISNRFKVKETLTQIHQEAIKHE